MNYLIVVTGASSGFGRMAANALAKAGYSGVGLSDLLTPRLTT